MPKRTTQLSTNIGRSCEHCGTMVGSNDDGDLSDSINHYISEHGYELLHVGTQTSRGDEGLWHHTVAVLSHDNPPAIAPPVEVVIGGIELPERPRNN